MQTATNFYMHLYGVRLTHFTYISVISNIKCHSSDELKAFTVLVGKLCLVLIRRMSFCRQSTYATLLKQRKQTQYIAKPERAIKVYSCSVFIK